MFRVKHSGNCDESKGTIWEFLRTMKRGYLENDQVEPGVCRGGGISQRPKVLQAINNSQLETPAKF